MIKKFVFTFSVLIIASSCATNKGKEFVPYGANNKLTLDKALSNANYKKDEFKKHIFITPDSRNQSVWLRKIKIKPYIGLSYSNSKNKPYSRLTISLNKEGWLFMEQIHFMCNGKDLKINMNHYDVDREAIYGSSIREYYDHALSKKEFDYLSRCKETDKYRLYGKKYYIDSSFEPEEIAYFQEVNIIMKEIRTRGYRSIANAKEKEKVKKP